MRTSNWSGRDFQFIAPVDCVDNVFLACFQYDNLTSNNADVDRIMRIIGWASALGTGLEDELDVKVSIMFPSLSCFVSPYTAFGVVHARILTGNSS